MKRTTLFCLLLLLAGVSLFLITRPTRITNAKGLDAPKSFVITYVVTTGGEPTALIVRAVKATGEWKETEYKFGGTTTIRAATSDAQYSMRPGDKVKQWVSRYSLEMDRAFRSADFLETHPDFVRKDTVAGLDAYVHRGEFQDGNFIVESTHSPLLGVTPVRTVVTQSGVPELRNEALRVEFRDVSEAEVTLTDVPTEFNAAETRAAAMRNSGLGATADALLKSIAEHKLKTR